MRQVSYRTRSTAQPLGGNVVRFVATADSVDRHGSRVLPSGMDATAFLKNPVFLWNHNSGDACEPGDILGRVIALTVEEVNGRQAVVADVEFAVTDAEGKPRARAAECLALVKAGLLNAVSIGFIARKSSVVDGVEVVTEFELVELSLVPVPSNSDALALRALRRRSITTTRGKTVNPDFLKKLQLEEGADAEALVAALQSYLVSTSDSPEDRKAVADAVAAAVGENKPESDAKPAPHAEPDGDEGEIVKALERTVAELKTLQGRVAVLESRAVAAPVAAPVQTAAKATLSERLFSGGNPAAKTATAPNFGTRSVSGSEKQARSTAERALGRAFSDAEWEKCRAKFAQA